MMKRTLAHISAALLLAAALLGSAGCQRRALTTADYSVQLNISIEKDILNYDYPGDPGLMRCIFYDSQTGSFVTQAFLPAQGGEVNLVSDREYDILVYNFDTEVTWLDRENWISEIYASTSLIHDSFKTKIRSRATKDGKEEIVYDPDHLYVGRLDDVYIPSRSIEAPEIVLDVTCRTVIQSWILEVETITGIENIASIAAVITGLADRNYIGQLTPTGNGHTVGKISDEYITVYFDTPKVEQTGEVEKEDGKKVKAGKLTARFNTFGWHPESGAEQVLTLVFTDISGKGHLRDVNISSQFPDNAEQRIRVKTSQIDIPEPPAGSGGGGFAPTVDEWEEIETEIII